MRTVFTMKFSDETISGVLALKAEADAAVAKVGKGGVPAYRTPGKALTLGMECICPTPVGTEKNNPFLLQSITDFLTERAQFHHLWEYADTKMQGDIGCKLKALVQNDINAGRLTSVDE